RRGRQVPGVPEAGAAAAGPLPGGERNGEGAGRDGPEKGGRPAQGGRGGGGGALVIAHRGASARELENSLAAFRAAGPLGADAVELDIHATADGTLVVHHDEAVAGRHIPHLTGRQVRELRLQNGEPVPTLPEALEAAG